MPDVPALKSPCIDVCVFDGTTGWCVGCGRTLPECRRWRQQPKWKLKAIAVELPGRLARLKNKQE